MYLFQSVLLIDHHYFWLIYTWLGGKEDNMENYIDKFHYWDSFFKMNFILQKHQHVTIYLSIYLSISLSQSIYIYLCLCVSIYLFISIYHVKKKAKYSNPTFWSHSLLDSQHCNLLPQHLNLFLSIWNSTRESPIFTLLFLRQITTVYNFGYFPARSTGFSLFILFFVYYALAVYLPNFY